MDDDQAFVQAIIEVVTDHESVNYRADQKVDTSDEGRNATIEVELFAGDRYRITIEELH
jgi:putative lipoic acid-binding regulatory protein